MSHFAKVLNGVVQKVIVAEQEFVDNYNDGQRGQWVQTSYNTRGGVHYDPETGQPSADQSKALRYNFAGINSLYDKNADAFYKPQPYPSWTLNTNTYLWEPPVAHPTEDGMYDWNEEDQTWDQIWGAVE